MLLYHLWLLIQKSLRYAWRLRTCRCCPKIVFELVAPVICLLFLILVRWIHTPSEKPDPVSLSNGSKPLGIVMQPTSIVQVHPSDYIFNYTLQTNQCPSSEITIEVVDPNLLNRLSRSCPHSGFVPFTTSRSLTYIDHLIINTTSLGHSFSYDCGYYNKRWCQFNYFLNHDDDSQQIQHPSVALCSEEDTDREVVLLKLYLQLQSLINRPMKKQQLSVHTWPCASYLSENMFQTFPKFIFIVILILIDGCILYSFNLLFDVLLEEKRQGITEMLRLISIRPILNSFAWVLRVLSIQIIINVLLIIILKSSFDGESYLPYVSVGFIIPTIMLWTIQVFSRAVLVAHFFTSSQKASIWSWLIYLISFFLALSSSIRLPGVLHLIASAWLPFYSIKRLFILLFRLNTNLGRPDRFTIDILLIWLAMLVGTILMWLLSFYLEQTRPGKYGIPRPWSWPIDHFRKQNRIKNQKRRESVAMQMVESEPNGNTTVRVNNLTKTYGRSSAGKQLAVDHISFQLEKSTIHGIIGHNGAGKTSTMEMMCGLLSCDCGTIEIHEKNLYENLPELRTCIGYCPQQDMLFSHLTVREQLEFYARVRSKKNHVDNDQIKDLLTMMEMEPYSQKLCHTLSGGMQRKVSILCAFVGNANVILLDEPSSSLDPVARRVLWSWLRNHKSDRTLLISSHLLDEVEELCDSVIILDSGRIRDQGTVLELKQRHGPPGDRLHLDSIPDYVPSEWVIDDQTHTIQVPDRKQLISLLEKLENEQIKYSLENVTLDDIFVKLTSETESPATEENTVKSQIEKLFDARTTTQRTRLWSQQILAILLRRSQVLLRRARLLPIVLLLYLAYALTPLYMPSSTLLSTSPQDRVRYIISSSPESIHRVQLKNLNAKFVRSFDTSRDFQQYLLGVNTWQSDYRRQERLIGVRIASSNQLECYIPSPFLPNTLASCLPVFAAFANYTPVPLNFLKVNSSRFGFENLVRSSVKKDPFFYCLYTLPIPLHLSIVLLSLILIIPTALIIQDYKSGLHSYSLIHGLCSPISWLITFLSDLLLCLVWLSILIVIERFLHSETFNGRFFALAPLFLVADLPFIYLIAKRFTTPILGATMVIALLLFAHFLYTLRVFIELVRGNLLLSTILHVLRWLLLLIFPNVNLYTLIITILRPYSCPFDDALLGSEIQEFAYERYSHKTLIHTLIFIAQWLVYFGLLVVIDRWKMPTIGRRKKGHINQQEEDDDVAAERHRLENMTEQDRQKETLLVDNLSKRYSGSNVPAVNRLTFAVSSRECFGLLGFNGSGKTTTFRMLVGELSPTGGHVYKNDKTSIGYCPQDDITFSALTVTQSIIYICRLHGVRDSSSLNEIILTQFQLEKYRHRLVSHLSGGTRRRLHLALCLIGSPTLLLLDEPTAKVDPLLRSHIRLILQHRPIDTSIVFASHSMLECEQLCDRLTILVRGNAKCLGSPRHLKEKYGNDYRIRVKPLREVLDLPQLTRVGNSNEYTYPKSSLSKLFQILEDLVKQKTIAPNYTVQLIALEHIFLSFQYSGNTTV